MTAYTHPSRTPSQPPHPTFPRNPHPQPSSLGQDSYPRHPTLPRPCPCPCPLLLPIPAQLPQPGVHPLPRTPVPSPHGSRRHRLLRQGPLRRLGSHRNLLRRRLLHRRRNLLLPHRSRHNPLIPPIRPRRSRHQHRLQRHPPPPTRHNHRRPRQPKPPHLPRQQPTRQNRRRQQRPEQNNGPPTGLRTSPPGHEQTVSTPPEPATDRLPWLYRSSEHP